MKPIPDCIPDILQTVLKTARLVSDDVFIHRKVLSKVMAELAEEPDFGSSPAELTHRCLCAACKALGVKDPYEKEKARRNRAMLGLEKNFRAYLESAPDRLQACLNLVIAGTIGRDILGRADLEQDILAQLNVPLARDDRESLRRELARAETVIYIVDAAGEILLDKLLMEEIGKKRKITAVVAKKPILAVATHADATAVGLDSCAEVIDPGAAMLGLLLERASRSFREAFRSADVVIVKGETNYGTLATVDRPAFFLLQAECEFVAERLGICPGSGALVYHAARPATARIETGDSGSS